MVEGNSSFLNELTTDISAMLTVIAADIGPENAEITYVASEITSQLVSQIVDWSSTPTVLADRSGRDWTGN